MDEQNFPDIFEEPKFEPGQNPQPQKRLEKLRTDVVVAGVCSGIAKYINTEPAVVRLLALLSLLLGVWTIAAYFVAAFLLPAEYDFVEPTDEKKELIKKVNSKSVTGGLLILAGLHLGFVSLGIISPDRFIGITDSFLFPFISIVIGAYFLGMKDYKNDFYRGGNEKRFIRSRSDRKFLGVCGGFANYLNVEPTTVRIIFLLSALLTLGFFAVIYFLFAFTIKMEESEIVHEQ